MRRPILTALMPVLMFGSIFLMAHGTAYAQSDVLACVAADSNSDYGSLLSVPADTQALIESYRSDWRDFCKRKPGRTITLAELYSEAMRIENAFEPIFEKVEKDLRAIKDRDAERKRTDAIHETLFTTYPSFIPGFEGSLWEQSFFSPSTPRFKKYASLGSIEDRLFFDNGIPLGDAIWEHPWIERTWDYGGCYLFGQFDWADEIRKIGRLKLELKNDLYLKQLAAYESSLFGPLKDPGTVICSCERKDAVMIDFQNVSKALEKEATLSPHLPEVRSTILSIESGKVRIASEREKHCSGG